MHPAYSVILFTTASGAGYGLLALLGLVGFNHGPASSFAFALIALVIALGLITIGLLSSTLHLGHPERAWRAVSQWRSSWLSREGIAALITYMPALAFGLAWSGLALPPAAIGGLGVVTAILCAVTVYCTGKIYDSLATIRAWHQPLTVPVYLAFALATGACLLAAISAFFDRFQAVQVVIAAAAVILTAFLKQLYWRAIDAAPQSHTIEAATGLGRIGGVGQWEVPHTAENFVQKEMGYAVARKHARRLRALVLLLLMATLVLLALSLLAPFLAIAAATLALIAAVVERWLFFAEARHVAMLFYGESRL